MCVCVCVCVCVIPGFVMQKYTEMFRRERQREKQIDRQSVF